MVSKLLQLKKLLALLAPGIKTAAEIVETRFLNCHFSYRSLDLSVKELNGKNYSLVIKNLAEVIDAEKSHWKVKTGEKTNVFNQSKSKIFFFSTDSVVVFLAKLKPITWAAVTMEEKKLKEAKAPKFDASAGEDPQASMMNMMKVCIVMVNYLVTSFNHSFITSNFIKMAMMT